MYHRKSRTYTPILPLEVVSLVLKKCYVAYSNARWEQTYNRTVVPIVSGVRVMKGARERRVEELGSNRYQPVKFNGVSHHLYLRTCKNLESYMEQYY